MSSDRLQVNRLIFLFCFTPFSQSAVELSSVSCLPTLPSVMRLVFSICLIHLLVLEIAQCTRDDVTPETWKKLTTIKSIKYGDSSISADRRYNCSGLIEELTGLGYNTTDCTTVRGDLWYRIDDLLTWDKAYEACTALDGSDFASIHNIDEFNLLRHLFWMPDQDRTANWIGLNDIVLEDRWRWTDGTSVDYGLRKWLAPMKEPNGGREENCVMYQSQVAGGGCCWADGLLDFRCSHELPAICRLRNPRASV